MTRLRPHVVGLGKRGFVSSWMSGVIDFIFFIFFILARKTKVHEQYVCLSSGLRPLILSSRRADQNVGWVEEAKIFGRMAIVLETTRSYSS